MSCHHWRWLSCNDSLNHRARRTCCWNGRSNTGYVLITLYFSMSGSLVLSTSITVFPLGPQTTLDFSESESTESFEAAKFKIRWLFRQETVKTALGLTTLEPHIVYKGDFSHDSQLNLMFVGGTKCSTTKPCTVSIQHTPRPLPAGGLKATIYDRRGTKLAQVQFTTPLVVAHHGGPWTGVINTSHPIMN